MMGRAGHAAGVPFVGPARLGRGRSPFHLVTDPAHPAPPRRLPARRSRSGISAMAQCSHSRPSDTFWKDRLETALYLLRYAVDRWILDGTESLALDDVLAVLLRGLTSPFIGTIHPLHKWVTDVGSLGEECTRLRKDLTLEELAAVTGELRGCLGDAVRAWTSGSLEDPPTERVLLDLVTILFCHRLVRRPPLRKIE
jgi:hypothetical protein